LSKPLTDYPSGGLQFRNHAFFWRTRTSATEASRQ
jgi:hypothetical protein